MQDISDLRNDFTKNQALEIENTPDNPLELFSAWFTEAKDNNIIEPNAMVISSLSKEGRMSSRTVLLKYFGEEGFVFFTNYGSQKAKDFTINPLTSACFPWYSLERQIMIEGKVEKISKLDSLKYFSSRPRGSQIGAWVSEQSSIISSRQILLDKVKQLSKHFADKNVPLPDFWGGYRIIPTRFEFWQGQSNRLHDRIEYLIDEQGVWYKQRLSP